MTTRTHTPLDRLVINVDHALRTVFGRPQTTERPDPAADKPETELSAAERKTAAGLMRVNHTGEVCAQALYQGQALTAKLPNVREKMERAALEENDHLDWCERRIKQLDSQHGLL